MGMARLAHSLILLFSEKLYELSNYDNSIPLLPPAGAPTSPEKTGEEIE